MAQAPRKRTTASAAARPRTGEGGRGGLRLAGVPGRNDPIPVVMKLTRTEVVKAKA